MVPGRILATLTERSLSPMDPCERNPICHPTDLVRDVRVYRYRHWITPFCRTHRLQPQLRTNVTSMPMLFTAHRGEAMVVTERLHPSCA
jgi:hypothetical protein